MANNNTKKKTNTNNKKNNTKKVDNSSKVKVSKNTSATKKVNNTKKEEVKNTIKNEEVKVEKVNEVKETVVKTEKKKFSLTSKQKDIILVLLVVVVLAIAIIITGGREPKLDIELPIALEGTPGFTEIAYSEYEEKLNTEAPFVVVIVRDGCSYCDMYKPVVEEVANEYGLPINYINLSNITSEEQELLSSSNSYLRKNQWGTPTTLFMYGKTVVDSIGGYVEKDTFVEFAKENFVVE